MRGQRLSVSLTSPRSLSTKGFVNLDSKGGVKEGKEAGFMIEILDEVANRAGFTW